MTLSLIFDKIHQVYEQAQEKLRKYLLYLRYDYRLTIWLNTRRYKSGAVFLNKHFDFIMRAALIAVGLVAGIIINRFGGSSFTQEVLSNYLVFVGMLLGGTIAIVFAISIFLLQGAADLYSFQYFEGNMKVPDIFIPTLSLS